MNFSKICIFVPVTDFRRSSNAYPGGFYIYFFNLCPTCTVYINIPNDIKLKEFYITSISDVINSPDKNKNVWCIDCVCVCVCVCENKSHLFLSHWFLLIFPAIKFSSKLCVDWWHKTIHWQTMWVGSVYELCDTFWPFKKH